MKTSVKNIRHIRICGGKNTACFAPLLGGIWYWGDDEILLAHLHAQYDYKNRSGLIHGQHGRYSRSVFRLQRSCDLGETWPEEESRVLNNLNFSLPVEEQRAILHLNKHIGNESQQRETIDMNRLDAIIAVGRAHIGKERSHPNGTTVNDLVVWAFRSSDRGHCWEKIPSIIRPSYTEVLGDVGNAYLKCADGSIMAVFVASGPHEGIFGEGDLCHPQLYMSVDSGVTWHYVSDIFLDPHKRITCSYPRIIELESGRLICTLGMWMHHFTGIRWISITFSDDGGLSWSEPRRINRWGVSPYPLLLEDGRIVIVYARRYTNLQGMACIISEDEGRTWSEEIILRDDASRWDIGYPVAIQLRNGTVLTAYYYQINEEDIRWGGRLFIAGTFFNLV